MAVQFILFTRKGGGKGGFVWTRTGHYVCILTGRLVLFIYFLLKINFFAHEKFIHIHTHTPIYSTLLPPRRTVQSSLTPSPPIFEMNNSTLMYESHRPVVVGRILFFGDNYILLRRRAKNVINFRRPVCVRILYNIVVCSPRNHYTTPM